MEKAAIPATGEARRGSAVMRHKLDLNTASAADLDAIPYLKGHGFEIVRYREERGRFTKIGELEEVPGLAGKWDGAEASLQIEGADT